MPAAERLTFPADTAGAACPREAVHASPPAGMGGGEASWCEAACPPATGDSEPMPGPRWPSAMRAPRTHTGLPCAQCGQPATPVRVQPHGSHSIQQGGGRGPERTGDSTKAIGKGAENQAPHSKGREGPFLSSRWVHPQVSTAPNLCAPNLCARHPYSVPPALQKEDPMCPSPAPLPQNTSPSATPLRKCRHEERKKENSTTCSSEASPFSARCHARANCNVTVPVLCGLCQTLGGLTGKQCGKLSLLRRAPGREIPETVPKAEAAPSGPAHRRTPSKGEEAEAPSAPLPAASAGGVPGDRAAPTPALAGSQHHRESDEHRGRTFWRPHLSPLYSGRESAREPSLSPEVMTERKAGKGRRLRGGGHGSRWGPRGTEGPPGAERRNSPELPLKQTRDALTCLPATNDTSEARDTKVRQKRPSMRGQTRQVPVASCWWECGMAPSHHKAGWQFLIKVNSACHATQQPTTAVIYPREMKTCVHTKTCKQTSSL